MLCKLLFVIFVSVFTSVRPFMFVQTPSGLLFSSKCLVSEDFPFPVAVLHYSYFNKQVDIHSRLLFHSLPVFFPALKGLILYVYLCVSLFGNAVRRGSDCAITSLKWLTVAAKGQNRNRVRWGGKIGAKLEVSYWNDSRDKLYCTLGCSVAQREIRYAEIREQDRFIVKRLIVSWTTAHARSTDLGKCSIFFKKKKRLQICCKTIFSAMALKQFYSKTFSHPRWELTRALLACEMQQSRKWAA